MFRKNSGTENFQAKEGASFTVLWKIFFISQDRKKLRQGNILCFRKFLVGKNILWIRGGRDISIFRRKVFVALYRNISLENTLVFQKNSCIEIFHALEGGTTVLSKIFVSEDRNEKLCKGTLLFPENFWYRKKIMDKRGHITIFSRNFCVSQCQNIS